MQETDNGINFRIVFLVTQKPLLSVLVVVLQNKMAYFLIIRCILCNFQDGLLAIQNQY